MAKPPSLRQTRPSAGGLDPKLQALYENLEILNGARGKGLDKAVLVRDLLDLGLAVSRKGVNGIVIPVKPGTGGNGTGDGGVVDPPEVPRGVLASGGFSTILVEWNKPTYQGHSYTEVLRSESDDFSTASLVSTTAANLYSDQVGAGKIVYYWVRFVNKLDVKGPVQSTNGVRGETQADIGDILDKLRGEIDETFLTPSFNSKLVNMEAVTKTVPDLSQKLTDEVIRIDGEIIDLSENTVDIIAEAALEAANGVDNEGYTRRKATAEIKLEQKVMVTELGAQAQQILTIRASVDDNKASIQENKTAIVKVDADTKKVVESITQRLDTQQSNIGGNTAKITSNEQTIVRIDNDLGTVNGSITSITGRIDKQQSDIAGNTASITSSNQTIVTQGSKIDKNVKDIADLDDSTTTAISSITTRLNSQSSDIDSNKASITTLSQTATVLGRDILGNKTSITALSDVVTSQKSEIDGNTSSISTQSQTIVQQGNKLNQAVIDLANLDSTTGQSISSLSSRIDKQQSDISGNTAGITSNSQTLVVIGKKADDNASSINGLNSSITSITNRLDTQQSQIGGNTASITTQSQTIATVEGLANSAISEAQTAQTAANKASVDAAAAAGIAGGKGKVIIQPNQPASTDQLVQNLWINTSGGANTPNRWSGSSWIPVTDQTAVDAAAAAVAAKAEAAEAHRIALLNAGKIQVVSETLSQLQSTVGNNSASITDQSQTIVTVRNTANSAMASAQSANGAANSANSKAVTAQAAADQAKADAATAAGIANGKGKVLIQPTPPVSTDRLSQNLWIDTNGNANTPKRWGGSSWIAVTDKTAKDAAAAAVAAKAAANANAQSISVMSQRLTTVESAANDLSSKVTQNTQTIATINADGSTAYKAMWGVKASIGDITAGIGLTVKKETGKPDVSQCTVIADQFSVGSKTGSEPTIYPFIVTSTGVFIDTAYIKAAKIQDLVAGEVVADNIKAGATLTAPYIKGGQIEIGSNFKVDANGNVTGSNVNFKSGTFTGTVNANSGVFNNVTINENCTVKGTVYAKKIIGDVYTAVMVDVAYKKSRVLNVTHTIYSGTIAGQDFARRVEFGSVTIWLEGDLVFKYYLNNVLLYTFETASSALSLSPITTPTYIATLLANKSGAMRIDVTGYFTLASQKSKIAAFKV